MTGHRSDGVDVGGRFLQAASYLVEWVQHIVTIGSGLMVLAAALLKDLVKDARAPMNYVIGGLLVLSYILMLLAIWKCLAFMRQVATTVLTAGESIGLGEELQKLKNLLGLAQGFFLAGFVCFALLAVVSLVTWASGWVLPIQPKESPKTGACGACIATEQIGQYGRTTVFQGKKARVPCWMNVISTSDGWIMDAFHER